jgi:fimbrial chaperone protein
MPKFLSCLYPLILGSALFFGASQAATLQVSPVSMDFVIGQQKTSAVTLRNPTSEPVLVDISLLNWTQAQGQDVYAPSQDLLINPSRFTLPPYQEQIIRIGVRSKTLPTSEKTYRMIVQNVPTPSAAGEGFKVQVVVKMALPIVFRLAEAKSAVKWSLLRKGDDLILRADNSSGDRFASFKSINVVQEKDKLPFDGFAVLAKSYRDFVLPAWGKRTGTLELNTTSGLKEQREILSIPAN